MSRALATLTRVRRLEVDRLRRDLVAAEGRIASIRDEQARLDATLAEERAGVGDDPLALAAFGTFGIRLAGERRRLDDLVSDAVRERERLYEALAEACAEVKKYETASAARQQREREEREHAEALILDDMALQRHARSA